MEKKKNDEQLLTFGGHLEVFRQMLFRILGVTIVLAIIIFCFKETTFNILFAPSNSDFVTYRTIEKLCSLVGWQFHFTPYNVAMINTELSSQFMTHLTTSIYLALLGASPYIVVELFRFVAPALYEDERRHSVIITIAVYVLFIAGVLMSYYVLFPFAFRFLGTYQVDARVINQINLSSYISTFTTLTFLLGVVFQIPVLTFFLAKMGIVDAEMMSHYRRHAIVLIALIAAIITPPDLLTLVLVTVPMYGLYEISIRIAKHVHKRK